MGAALRFGSGEGIRDVLVGKGRCEGSQGSV